MSVFGDTLRVYGVKPAGRLADDTDDVDGALRAFQAWMDGGGDTRLFLWSIALTLSIPAIAVVHELGHAAVGLLRTEGLVGVHVGREPAAVRFRLGRLAMSLDPRPAPRGTAAGYAAVAARLTARERVALALGGPAAELALAAIIAAVGHRAVGGLIALDVAYNLVPMKHGPRRSDGWHLVEALRGRNTGQSDETDTAARAQLMFESPDRHLAARATELAAVADGDPLVLRAAFAGWCWRDAQRVDNGGTRDASLDALHDATLSGAVGPALAIRAAKALADSSTPFGLLFEAGLAGALAPSADLERQRFAFRYGGALRDIERIRA